MDYADYIPEVPVVLGNESKGKKLDNPYMDKTDTIGMKRSSMQKLRQ